MTNKLALIDGDILKYQMGFSVQKTLYTQKSTGIEFMGKKAVNLYLKETEGDFIEEDWEKEIQVEPFEQCKYLIDLKIDEIMTQTGSDTPLVCLSPSKTFRDDLAVTRVYKGNRVPNKPVYSEDILKYLLKTYTCETGDNVEADDVMGMRQTKDSVIATIDKDLNMIAGWHYNFNTGEKYLVDDVGADEFFYAQVIAGDSTDNIQGIPKMGMKKATDLVDSFFGDHQALVEEIHALYEDHYYERPYEVLKEMAGLVWILRTGETPATAGWRSLLL